VQKRKIMMGREMILSLLIGLGMVDLEIRGSSQGGALQKKRQKEETE